MAIACAVDLAAGAWLLRLGTATPVAPADLGVVLAWLLVFRHDAVLRWRRSSVVLAGALLASGGIHLSALGLRQWGVLGALGDLPWAAWAFPWPAHVLGWAYGRLWPRRPLRIPGRGAWASAARRALLRTPCGWRPARTDEDAPLATLPFGCLAQLDAVMGTPVGAIPLHPEGPAAGMGKAVKRAMDLILVIGGAPLVAPVLLALALIVRLREGGPAFYSQVRITLGGKEFRIHKFRSMVRDAEPDGQPVWPEEGDPRITPLGRRLRRFWLDELPQVWDVFRGPLSLVGPRPERPVFVQDFSQRLPNYPLRHQVKAGITGLAQVTGFVGNTSIDRRLRSDLRYMRRWSPVLDLKILVGTVFRAMKRPPIRVNSGVSGDRNKGAIQSPPKRP